MTGQPRRDRWDKSTGTGQPEQVSQDNSGWTRPPGQVRLDGIEEKVSKRSPRQASLNRIAKTDQPGQVSLVVGQPGQVCETNQPKRPGKGTLTD